MTIAQDINDLMIFFHFQDMYLLHARTKHGVEEFYWAKMEFL